MAAGAGWRGVSDDGEEYGGTTHGAGGGKVCHADAEAVRAYLVSVRGGAPLLSSTDAHLLFVWLSAGVRIGVIVRAIDTIAQRRIAKKVRAPLALASCRAEIDRVRRGGKVRGNLSTALPVNVALAVDEPPACVLPGESAVAQAYAATLLAVDGLDAADAGARCDRAVELGREFYEFAWNSLDPAAALADAATSLAADGAALDQLSWGAACEAIARDRLRRRYPRLTATAIWSEYGLGLD